VFAVFLRSEFGNGRFRDYRCVALRFVSLHLWQILGVERFRVLHLFDCQILAELGRMRAPWKKNAQ
jgi:hypothetical protein